MIDREKLLSVDDAAAELGVKPITLRKWIDMGKFPAERVGKTYVIYESDLAKAPVKGMGVGYPKGKRRKPVDAEISELEARLAELRSKVENKDGSI